MRVVYNLFGGRTTFFAFWFFVCGVILAFLGKLTGFYMGLATGIQVIVAAHSISKDVTSSPATSKDSVQAVK